MRPARPRGFVNHAFMGTVYGAVAWPVLAVPMVAQHWPSAATPQRIALVALAVAGEVAFALLGGVVCEPVLLLLGLGWLCKLGVTHYAARLGLEGAALGMAQLAAGFGVPGALVGLPMLLGLVAVRLRGR